MQEVNCNMVTYDNIRNWYIKRRRTTAGLCDLDCYLLERAQKFVADKNKKFLANLSLTCNGKDVYVKFSAGAQKNRFTFMVCENEIHGSVVRDGIIEVECGSEITPQDITEYLTCCPNDCEIDRRLLQEAIKYVVENSLMGSFECYGKHISYSFAASSSYSPSAAIACVVGNEIIIHKPVVRC